MRCPNCGNQVPKESMFCNKCGTRLGTEPFMRPVSPSEDTQYLKGLTVLTGHKIFMMRITKIHLIMTLKMSMGLWKMILT